MFTRAFSGCYSSLPTATQPYVWNLFSRLYRSPFISICLGENYTTLGHLSTHVTRHLLIVIFCRITEES